MQIDINGESYPLRYSLRALKQFEQRTKLSVFSLGESSSMSAEAMAWLIYCGIVDGCKFEGVEFKKTLADIEPFIDLGHVAHAVEALQQYTEGSQKKAKGKR